MSCTQLIFICGSIFIGAGEVSRSLPYGHPCLFWTGIAFVGLAALYSIVAPIVKHEMKKALPKPSEDEEPTEG